MLNWPEIEAFGNGHSTRSYTVLGAQQQDVGFQFSTWAPNADEVCVIGDFNGWEIGKNQLEHEGWGVWRIHIESAKLGDKYKFAIKSRGTDHFILKADPFSRRQEVPPATASVLFSSDFEWDDEVWIQDRVKAQSLQAPISIYEVHLGSWRRKDGLSLGYRDIAEPLIQHVKKLGFTHVEFLPLTHHPFYGSWGYQCLGYFAPSEMFGEPDDLKYLINELHKHNIGVILDWVPAHFPTDEEGLAKYDGTHLFEHADARKGFHPDWKTAIFNFGRHEIRSFLLSSARFWVEEYHIDGIRVDAVASMLYLDYSREPDAWVPNADGGNENWEAVSFLKELNTSLYGIAPGILTIAEESTSWPGVSKPTYDNGLGFGLKWDMGWMHDVLQYLAREPIHRSFHHNELTFRSMYAFSENFVLALSHDEVVHGKGSLMNKMPGDAWQKRANMRLLFAMMFAQPGKKMLFMGMELGQYTEWNHDGEIDWAILGDGEHQKLMACVQALNALYKTEPALHQKDVDPTGVHWLVMDDDQNSVFGFLRRSDKESVLFVCNLTPEPRHHYGIGVPLAGEWKEILSTDQTAFGGSGVVNGVVSSVDGALHGMEQHIQITLPPLGATFWKCQTEES